MRDEVLEQLMESVCLLEMVEEVLLSHESATISEALVRGMRVTLQNVREGISESCEWIAAVEEECLVDSPDEEPSDDAVIAAFLAEERKAEDALMARTPVNARGDASARETHAGGGRTLLESILRQGPSAGEVMQRRHQAHRSELGENRQSSRWTTAPAEVVTGQPRPDASGTASVERKGSGSFILDSIQRIVE